MSAQSVVMTGNVVAAPELSFGASGAARCTFTIACQDRYRDRDGVYQDGSPYFCRCVAWNGLAEHVGATVGRGDRVMVSGEFVSSSWDKEDGTKGYATDLRASEVGLSLLWAEARVTRVKGSRRPAPDPSASPSWVTGAADEWSRTPDTYEGAAKQDPPQVEPVF